MEKITMQDVWLLLQPSKTFDTRGRFEKCMADWSQMDADQQQRVYKLLQSKKDQAALNPNPYFALNDAMQEVEQQQAKSRVRQLTLSYNEYYKRYGTTEPQDGWQMVTPKNPGDPPLHYVKNA